MRTQFLVLLLAVVSSLLVSCSVNAPTPSSQITASPVSELKYADYTCASLTAALESLAQRNLDLVRAQEQRIKSSDVQGTILGVGQGDGAEASELSKVRGEQAAAAKVFNAKRCEYNR
jgi:hypothetical protein